MPLVENCWLTWRGNERRVYRGMAGTRYSSALVSYQEGYSWLYFPLCANTTAPFSCLGSLPRSSHLVGKKWEGTQWLGFQLLKATSYCWYIVLSFVQHTFEGLLCEGEPDDEVCERVSLPAWLVTTSEAVCLLCPMSPVCLQYPVSPIPCISLSFTLFS